MSASCCLVVSISVPLSTQWEYTGIDELLQQPDGLISEVGSKVTSNAITSSKSSNTSGQNNFLV